LCLFALESSLYSSKSNVYDDIDDP
jgi:hypothetical protein